MRAELKELIDYMKPFLDKATEGEYSGHNFNSYLPKTIKQNIPMCFRDLISTSLHQIAIKSKSVKMSKWYFDWLNDEDLKTVPSGCEPYYMPWILYEAIKCLQQYLEIATD